MGAIYHFHGPRDSIIRHEFSSNLSIDARQYQLFFLEIDKLIPKLTKKML